MIRFFLLCVLLICEQAIAKVEVAFLVVRSRTGETIELEEGGRFGHVAIRFNGSWLQAHPLRGVVLSDDLSDLGELSEILVDENRTLQYNEVHDLLGLSYDHRFRWEDDSSSYCSKLVAKLLGVPPVPMRFDGEYWRKFKSLPRGEPGVSPDGLFHALVERGYARVNSRP